MSKIIRSRSSDFQFGSKDLNSDFTPSSKDFDSPLNYVFRPDLNGAIS